MENRRILAWLADLRSWEETACSDLWRVLYFHLQEIREGPTDGTSRLEEQGNLPTVGLLTNRNSNGLLGVSQRSRDKSEIQNYAGQSTHWPCVHTPRNDVWISTVLSTQGICLPLPSVSSLSFGYLVKCIPILSFSVSCLTIQILNCWRWWLRDAPHSLAVSAFFSKCCLKQNLALGKVKVFWEKAWDNFSLYWN